jgi:hypothetical protein
MAETIKDIRSSTESLEPNQAIIYIAKDNFQNII